ncbi:hypothetical protein VP01_5040g2 [Puccinia sorghi]|uniref:Reverse transcriptase Ty1/copia-type domain-containing protein n=1 Tax=Puccinia sorghi TaxID=27349 RepID=A0A0L6UNK8_9BASI|nr:hypothetical protein VP01_5040g2 [Puccinia sorghi]
MLNLKILKAKTFGKISMMNPLLFLKRYGSSRQNHQLYLWTPKNWYDNLTNWFREIDYNQLTADLFLFIHKSKKSFIFFHVDDLVVIGDVKSFEEVFLSQFPNSSAHDPDNLLGMDLTYSSKEVTLLQRKLIEKGLELAGLLECFPVYTPLSVGIQLKEATESEKRILNYLACMTRPDLDPAVSIFSSFINAPGISHWKKVIHCWKYCCD